MATKTFKIGLSNTDKQNMAQEVYERLLALTFPEYETTESYEVGDFVVYNDQLYKCIGATTGAWDSTKWQLATLNDLLTDIEDAVAFVNDKANVDGNYPTMTVGVADNLSPYDEESGIKQHAPFNFQASGTNNGSDPTATVGSLAIMSEKRGNSVVVNQLQVQPTSNSNMYANDTASLSVSSGVVSFTVSAQNGNINFTPIKVTTNSAHKYLISVDIKSTSSSVALQEHGIPYTTSGSGNFETVSYIETGYSSFTFIIMDRRASDWDEIQCKNFYVIDLTQWFGSNDAIPADLLSHPENFFRYYQGSLAYNAGTLVNANGRYVKCIGRNQWDEEWEVGDIDTTTGQNSFASGKIRSKNYIKLVPNTPYYFKKSAGSFIALYGYDANKNFVGYFDLLSTPGSGNQFSLPSNVCYMRFAQHNTSTYNNDITISLYYEDESGYDQYYPYEVLTNNDTGVEVLRSAGSVADIKKPDGSIVRNVGYVDLGDLSWNYNQAGYFTSTGLQGTIKGGSFYTKANAVAEKYEVLSQAIADDNGTMFVADDGELYIYDLEVNTPDGMFFYALEEPTTEQGTPYSENIAIDDFGTMDFSGTSGVPQGNNLFYPVDYKAYLDTLHKYSDGDPDNLALKSDLAVVDNKIGAKLPECPTTTDGTYVLKATVSDGSVVYNWVLEE